MIKSFVLSVFAALVLCLAPAPASCQINCSSKTIEASESELEKYIVNPWYADEDNINAALVSIQTRTDYDESLLEIRSVEANSKEEKAQPGRNYSGSVETEIILGLTDFIIDRAKAETIQWYMEDIQTNLCNGNYQSYFYNTCVMRSQSKDTMPFLPGLVAAFRKDIEILPAGLLCKYYETDKGYYLISLAKEIIDGKPAENTLAGLAENALIDAGCVGRETSLKKSTCDLYVTGLLAQTYLKWDATRDWKASMADLGAKMNAKNFRYDMPGDHQQKQFMLKFAATLQNMRVQVKKIKRARKEGNQDTIIAAATLKLGEDLTGLIYNPFYLSIAGVDRKAMNYMKPTIKAVSSVMAGRYSEALLDFNKIINDYDGQLKNDYVRVRKIVVERIVDSEGMTFDKKDFADDTKRKNVCLAQYGRYYPQEHPTCASVADLNAMIERKDFFEQAFVSGGEYEKTISALIMIYYQLENEPQGTGDLQRKSLLKIINRLVLESMQPEIPKSKFCYGAFLEAYYDWFNPDTIKKLEEVEGGTVNDRIVKMKDAITAIQANLKEDGAKPTKCTNSIQSIVSNLELASPDNSVQKYLPTVASLATAKTQDEVKNVLNDSAASVGSWRLKQKKEYTGSFGAMLGLDFGYEYLGNSTNDGWATGLFAPIGFDFTTKKLLPNNTACGIFVSLLDLGTVASMRLSDGSAVASKGGNLHISEVASPGAYVHVSVKNTPVVVGLGWSYVPLLRTEDVNGEKTDRSGSRVLLFLAVDLPMYFF